MLYMGMHAADEATQDYRNASEPPSKLATPSVVSSSPAAPQTTSPASVQHAVPNGDADASAMPPPVDSNQPKYRSAVLGLNSKPASGN